MSRDAEGPTEPETAAKSPSGRLPADPAAANSPDGLSGRIVETPEVLVKGKPDGGPSPAGPDRPDGAPEDGPGDGNRSGAVILTFPMDRVRRPSRPADTGSAMHPPSRGDTASTRLHDAASDEIEPRSAEDWRLAAAIMADAEAQAVKNAVLARESQVRLKEAADAFQRTQATAAEVRKTLAGQSVQGLRDSAAKLRETVAWMDQVLGALDR